MVDPLRFSRLRGALAKCRDGSPSPAVTLTALLAVVYLPLFAGKLIFNRDLSRFIYPMRWFVRDSLARGDSPWWTPHIGLGHSMLADPQSAIFYPVNLLHHLGPLPFMLMMVMFLHLVWGALGMAGVARSFRLGRAAALTAGLAWALSGYVASLWTNGARLASAAWIPWQVLAFVGVASAAGKGRGSGRAAAWLGVACAMGILAGDVFVAIMGAMLGLGLATAWLLGERFTRRQAPPLPFPESQPGRRLAMRFLGASTIALGLGVLLAAVALLPAARALEGTERAGGVPASVAEAGSFHPVRVLEFAAPEAFARAWYLQPDSAWVGSYLGGAPLSLSAYFGGSVLALLLLPFVPLRKRDPGEGSGADREPAHDAPAPATAVFVAVVGLVFLLFAFGRHTPAHGLLRALVVPLGYMRAPEKYLLAVVPCVSLLAGWGCHRLVSTVPRPSWKWGLCVPASLLLLALLAPALLPSDLGAYVRQGASHALLAALLVLVAWPIARRRTGWAGAFLLLLLAADLGLGSRFTLRYSDHSALRPPELVDEIQRQSAQVMPFPRLYRGGKVQASAALAGSLDGDRVTHETLRENIGVPFGVANLPGYGVAIPPAFTGLLDRGRLDALRLLATDYALLSSPRPGVAIPDGLSALSGRIPGVRLYRVDRTLPRVFVTFEAERRPGFDLASHLLDADVVAGERVLLDERQPGTGEPHPGQAPVPCHLDEFANTLVRATCDVPFAGLAVFVEQYATGWRARVDGVEAPLLQANLMMRAVPVPAGKHTIALAYEPPGLRQGMVLSLLGLLVLLAVLLMGRRSAAPTRSSAGQAPA